MGEQEVRARGAPSAHPGADHRSTLPAPRSPLIGRDATLRLVRTASEGHRLVTVVGPAGMGKTRVAIEAARGLGDRFRGGTYLVDLTRCVGDDDVAGAVIDGIGRAAPAARSREEHLRSELAGLPALLVVDNCEHVVAGAARVVDDLLRSAPDLRVIATSREPLRLDGEHLMRLPPLGAGSTDSPAVRLFVERARSVGGLAHPDRTTLAAVYQLVQRLDGMPLAIELAAARTRALSPEQILDLLDDRFRLLADQHRGVRRHDTLDAAIRWSWDLLDPEDRRLLCDIAPCSGAVSLRTVAHLLECDELTAVDHVERLTTRSLVEVVETGGPLRGYRMLESIREFCLRELEDRGELDEARRRVEDALLPPDEVIAADHAAFVDGYLMWSEVGTLEAATRRAAGAHAARSGRAGRAVHLLASATSPIDGGGHRWILDMLDEMERTGALQEVPYRRSALYARISLQTFVGAYVEAIATAEAAVGEVDEDDAWRRIPEAWLMCLLLAVDSHHVADRTAQLLPRAMELAPDGPPDWSVSFMATTRSDALKLTGGDTDEMLDVARVAVDWAPPGAGTEFALASLLLGSYLRGREPVPEAAVTVDAPVVENGYPLATVAAVLAVDMPVRERARRLCALARRRPLGRLLHEESPYLVAFAWLAIEEGDLARAERLLEAFVPRDTSSGVAGAEAIRHVTLARTGAEPTPAELMAPYLDTDTVERLAALAPRRLSEELRHWDELIDRDSAGRGHAPSRMRSGAHPPPGASTERLRLDVLGPLSVTHHGTTLDIGSTQQRALLSTLALHAGRAVPTERLMDAIWGTDPPMSSVGSLRSQISRLRSTLGSGVISGDSAAGYALAVEPDSVDVHRFISLVSDAPGTAAERRENLTRALGLWRGTPLPDVADTSEVRAEVAALEERHAATEEALAETLAEEGREAEAIVLLERLAAEAPLRENRWTLLVDTLTAAGRAPEALRAYQRARRVLAEELGLDPGSALRAAESRALGAGTGPDEPSGPA